MWSRAAVYVGALALSADAYKTSRDSGYGAPEPSYGAPEPSYGYEEPTQALIFYPKVTLTKVKSSNLIFRIEMLPVSHLDFSIW